MFDAAFRVIFFFFFRLYRDAITVRHAAHAATTNRHVIIHRIFRLHGAHATRCLHAFMPRLRAVADTISPGDVFAGRYVITGSPAGGCRAVEG